MANNFSNKLWQKILPGGAPGGNVLDHNGSATVINTSDSINKLEPYGTKVPGHVKGRNSGMSQPNNTTSNLKISDIQSALRSAERGDTTRLFAIYRDVFTATGTVAAAWSARKLAVLSEPYRIVASSESPLDIEAASIIQTNIDKCKNWYEFLSHMMNSVLYPVAVGEKIFRTISDGESNDLHLRYVLDQIYPVDYTLINYKLPYLPQGTTGNVLGGVGTTTVPDQMLIGQSNRPEDLIYDQDSWEPELRLYSVYPNGMINYSWNSLYSPDPDRHIVYRTNLLNGIAKDNFGGLGKAVLFWAVMEQMGRDMFLRLMNKYGMPYVVATADTSQVDTMNMLETALANSVNLNALVLNKDAQVEIKEVALAGAADGHTKFQDLCRDQICKLINGQTLSSNAEATGMGSGTAKLQGSVRQDLVEYDHTMLSQMLERQLFRQILDINNCRGGVPKILWGKDVEDTKILAETLSSLNSAGIEPTMDSFTLLSEKFGFAIQKRNESTPPSGSEEPKVL